MRDESLGSLGQALIHQPRIWALLDDRPGHQTQVKGLADRLGLPFETRTLVFNRLNRLPNPLLGASLFSLNQRKSDSLTAPFPDIVIAMGRRCLPVARWLKRASGGRSKLVHIGRKGITAADDFALLITCAHFNMPSHAHRLLVTLPPTQVTRAGLAVARDAWADLLARRQKPHIVFLVGGESALHSFPREHGVDLLKRAEAATEAIGGSLSVVTSRRTPPLVVEAMQEAANHAVFQIWAKEQTSNPYLGYLAWADGLIVTGESESMLAEAAATGAPLHIASMPGRTPGAVRWLKGLMTFMANGQNDGALAGICRGLFNAGWITPSRDFDKLHSLMYEAGLARPFIAEIDLAPPAENRTLEQFADRMTDIVSSLTPPSLQA